jgi:hypothetical protein
MKQFFPLLLLFIVPLSSLSWQLSYEFKGTPADYRKDRGQFYISDHFEPDHNDYTNGFKDAYSKFVPGDNNLFIDANGYIVLQPNCPNRVNGECIAVKCGEMMVNEQICECDNDTIAKKKFPHWCQLGWSSAKIISKKEFNIRSEGGLFVFEDVWIPRGRPVWPAIWLLPETDPIYGGEKTKRGGDWKPWPNNGEIDIMETIGIDPRIYGTIHYQCGDEYNGWPGLPVSINDRAKRGTAYNGPLRGNVLATRNEGDNPMNKGGHIGSLCFKWQINQGNGTMFAWYLCDGNPLNEQKQFIYREQIDVFINRVGTNSIGDTSGDGTGTLSFNSTPFWPGSRGNSPPLTLYKGWSGNYTYGFQGYFPIQGNVKQSKTGIHNGPHVEGNPDGLGVVPKFDESGKPINNTIDHLFEPLVCSMIGDWENVAPLPWKSQPCKNPPNGYHSDACPMTGRGSENSYDNCWVEGATKPGVGWWSNSPMAKGVKFAPFDEKQNWNLILNVAIGGDWPRGDGEEGIWGKNFDDVQTTNLKMKSIKYYEYK